MWTSGPVQNPTRRPLDMRLIVIAEATPYVQCVVMYIQLVVDRLGEN